MKGRKDKMEEAVAIYFSESEYNLLCKAKEITGLKDTNLIRILLKKSLNEIKKKRTLTFEYSLVEKQFERQTYKNKVLRLNSEDYSELRSICNCTCLTPSNLIKFWIMPELEKIIEDEGLVGEYK